MSAALQLTSLAASAGAQAAWHAARRMETPHPSADPRINRPEKSPDKAPVVTLAFYRKHTEKTLRRYLYASMLVGRAPSILSEPVARGWASSRPVHTFEDSVIFVLDVEKCLARLSSLDRMILARLVLQEYTQSEVALMLGLTTRAVFTRFAEALDRLTRMLLDSGILVLPY